MVVLARYEPILLALLKRREVTAGALVKAKEQAQELRGQLRPLKEEIQKLKLQRACLEEKLKLIHLQRREDMGQYKVSKMAGGGGMCKTGKGAGKKGTKFKTKAGQLRKQTNCHSTLRQ